MSPDRFLCVASPGQRRLVIGYDGPEVPMRPLAALLLNACTPDAGQAGADLSEPAPGSARGWAAEVRSRLLAQNYAFEAEGDGWVASTEEQGLRSRFEDGAATIETSCGETVTFTLAGWGRPDAVWTADPPSWVQGSCVASGAVGPTGACIRRLEGVQPGLVESWENTPRGLEQSFEIARSPGGGDLVVDLRVDGAMVSLEGEHATLHLSRGCRLRYDGLLVTDATGRKLGAWMEATREGIRLRVNTARAIWPVLIDPVVSSYWYTTGSSSSEGLGSAVAGAGDINGDGYDEVLVAGETYSSSKGHVYLYYGTPTGPELDATSVGSGGTGAQYGHVVTAAGDINGDGYDDFAISAPYAAGLSSSAGRFTVAFGGASGISSYTTVVGESSPRFFGTSLDGGGDVNGDGYDDLVVGAPGEVGTVPSYGSVTLYYGSASGISSTSDWSYTTTQSLSLFGSSVAMIGDANGDGYDDIAVGAERYDDGSTDEGEIFVFYGSATGPGDSADWSYDCDASSCYLGSALASAGDVNGDGYDDLLAGADGGGYAMLFKGDSDGFGGRDWRYYLSGKVGLGETVDGAGDVDGDGYDDIILGASDAAGGDGSFYVFLGTATTPGSSADYSVTATEDISLGSAVGGAGDVDGDGFDDIVIGASGYHSADKGEAFIYYGSSSGPTEEEPWSVDADSSLLVGTASVGVGDVDGDGYGDFAAVAVNTYDFVYVYEGSSDGTLSSPTQLGASTSTRTYGDVIAYGGDMNADGYSEVVVSDYASTTYTGYVRVYTGSSSGVSTSRYTTLSGSATYASFGSSAASVGDANDDGYDDLVIGSEGLSGSMGGVYLYKGYSAGVYSVAQWSLAGTQTGALLGSAVAGAGDVDGDGYPDLLIGAYAYDDGSTDEGAAFLVYGDSSWFASSADWKTGGDQASAHCDQVAAPGDVDGDGYDDIAVGCPDYDSGSWTSLSAAGRVRLWLGGSSGPASSADWEVTGTDSSEYFGRSLSPLGDVNADGFDDFAVGAYGRDVFDTDQGAVDVFLGSASGPSEEADLSFVLQSATSLGYVVGHVTDFDGDGGDELLATSSESGETFLFELDDADGDQAVAWLDCDDSDPSRYPGAEEACDDIDNDCNGRVDDDPPTWYADADGDGYGDDATATVDCTAPDGAISTGGDCDDEDASINPAATESCDGVDDDCDDEVDEAGATGSSTWYSDMDGDGYGDADTTTASCSAPTGYISDATDCDDTDASVSPAALERCNAVDDDCDGTTDEAGSPSEPTWYLDLDGDGFGSTAGSAYACSAPAGYAALATDCDDEDATIWPGATETCNEADDDCDGATDEGVTTTYYADADADGFGAVASAVAACSLPAGYVSDATDCDDSTGTTHPGATERCDGVDEDCDGVTDPSTSVGASSWYLDADGDGYGSATSTLTACTEPSGYVGDATDCDDAHAEAYPGASEIWYDGIDEACDGGDDYDADADGYDGGSGGVDCDDADDAVHPGAGEIWYDGIDEACDGGDDFDADADGHTAFAYGGDDCDDARSDVYPGASETWYDGVDQDCDGNDDDQDGDGVAVGEDCDDQDAAQAADCDTGGDGDTDDTDDTGDTGSDDTDEGHTSDSGAGPGDDVDTTAGVDTDVRAPKDEGAGCGCAQAGGGGSIGSLALGVLALVVTRRRPRSSEGGRSPAAPAG